MNIVWRRLTLTGFGRFVEPVTIELEPGVNVLVAPNERGKSTLMAGFAATLFGLPAISDASQFGQAKYRPWGNARRFEGELEFVRGDDEYKVWRDFASHAVKVSRRTASGWEDVVTGEHNPRARRRNEAYESFLRETVGVETVELFWSVFALGSPLPEAGELDDHVQRLVSGAGSAHYGGALKELVETAAGLTKSLKEAGVAANDRRNDGELERLLRQEQQLREDIESGRAAVDERQQVQRRLDELTREQKAAAETVQRAEAALEAWSEWRQTRAERRRALAEQSQARRAWDEYEALAREADAGRAELERQFPEWVQAAREALDKLSRLKQLEDGVEARRLRRRGEIAAAVARAEEKTDAWRQFVELRERWRADKRKLSERYAPFEEADEHVRALYARFEPERERLRGQVAEARRRAAADEEARNRRRAAEERFKSERQKFLEQYGDLAELDPEAAAAAIDERLEALRRREELQAQQMALLSAQAAAAREARTERAGAYGIAAAGIFAGAVLAFLLWSSAGPLWASVVGLLVAGGGLYRAFAGAGRRVSPVGSAGEGGAGDPFPFAGDPLFLKEEEERIARGLSETEQALAPDRRLGPFTEAGAHQLGVLSQRLAARAAAETALAEAEAALRSFREDPEAADGLAAAEEAEAAFLRLVEPGLAAYGEDGVARAWSEWQQLTSTVDRTEEQLRAWSFARFGVETTEPDDVLLGPAGVVDPQRPLEREGEGRGGPAAVWRELARIALSVEADEGRGALTVADLAEKMAAWTGDEAERVVTAFLRAETEGDEGAEAEEIAGLRRELEPVLAPAGGDAAEAAARGQRYKDGLADVQRIAHRQAGLLAGQGVADGDELHVRIVDAGNRAEAARRGLEELSARHPELPDPDGADDGEFVAERLQRLQTMRDEARSKARDAAEQYRHLVAREAALGAVHTVNIAAAELELKRLEERRRQIEFEIRTTALAHRELALAAKDYEETHRHLLAEKATAYFRRFSGRQRDVLIDEQFRVDIQDPDGPRHPVAQLSQGARDQLFLALRLAVADLVAGEAPLPLLLDDVFVHCDEGRRDRIRRALESLEGRRQTVLFSHRDEFRNWGRAVAPRGEGWEGT